mgnify:CR=1 FL=1
MTMPNPAGGEAKQEMLLIGDTMYMGMGDRYMSISLDSMRGQGMPDMSANLDPKVQKKAFEDALTDFKQSGEAETLDEGPPGQRKHLICSARPVLRSR